MQSSTTDSLAAVAFEIGDDFAQPVSFEGGRYPYSGVIFCHMSRHMLGYAYMSTFVTY